MSADLFTPDGHQREIITRICSEIERTAIDLYAHVRTIRGEYLTGNGTSHNSTCIALLDLLQKAQDNLQQTRTDWL